MPILEANLSTLPPAQRSLWPELGSTPRHFTLYGGTALSIRLGHRVSIDFDFFSNRIFDPDELAQTIPYLRESQRVRVAPNTITCRVDRGGPVLVSFFGGLGLGRVAPPDVLAVPDLKVASLLDLAGTKVAVVQKRAEVRDYVDIDALLRHGVDLALALAAGRVVHGPGFNHLITLKALTYFGDVPDLPLEVRTRLCAAVDAVDPTAIPVLRPWDDASEEEGRVP